MHLPEHAPGWARRLVRALVDAGFAVDRESRGGMAGYAVELRRQDCQVTLGGDRGEFDVWLAFPNPRRGRGHRRQVDIPVEDYCAAQCGHTDARLLLSEARLRAEAVAEWLAQRVAVSAPLTLDDDLLRRIGDLQRARAKALFGKR